MSWLLGGALVLLGIWCFKQVARAAHEQPKFSLQERVGEVEIRLYEPYITASVKVEEDKMRPAMNSAFRRLANYIFGGNKKSQKIAMTSPVEFQMEEEGSTMLFMIPSGYKLDELPQPDDASIVFEEQPQRLLAALRFPGQIDEDMWRKKSEVLLEELAKSDYEVVGQPVFFGYDPPVVPPPLRRNEVLVEVQKT